MTTRRTSSDTQALAEDLRRTVDGEVRFDTMSRALYSTDASIYQIQPVGVVIPRSKDDVVAVVETANRHDVPVLPRGGGTSLAGQTVGPAIVMDFSKYMNEILEVNSEEHWVRVQPGIILDELNFHMRRYGLIFAPDPSTSNRANVGGALGNNSCGAHSIIWGKTIDNVISMNVVLSDGKTASFGLLDKDGMDVKTRRNDLEGQIYLKLRSIGAANKLETLTRYPKILRRVSGYNLDEFNDDDDFNMARFVVGSEGTLVSITDTKLRLVKRPKMTALAVLHFRTLIESMEATVATLELQPSAVEHIGSMIIRQARAHSDYTGMTDFIEGDPDSLLVIEMTGESHAELEYKLDRLEQRMIRGRLGYAFQRVTKPEDQAKVWKVRKAGLGLMMNVTGTAKPLPFVEDTAVTPEVLPEYIQRFDEIIRNHGTTAGYYGHASVGCLHIRPLIDLKLQEGVGLMLSIAREISDLVLEFGGSMSGEHGDGLARSVWIEKMFGPRIYDAFREVKQAFDPKGIMNPGKIVDSPPMTDNLRYGPSYDTLKLSSVFAYRKEGGFVEAIEMCNGQGTCRKVTEGTMCPSYMATRDEEHSTRGRANALRSAISGALPVDSLTSKRLYNVMDLCLECKGCKMECPSNVDMARLKYEFLYLYHQANGYPVRNRLFGNISEVSRLGSFFAPISNWIVKSSLTKEILDKFVGIDQRRDFPIFTSQTFTQWFRARGGSSQGIYGQVLLFADTFTNYNHPEIGISATLVLERLGYQVVLVPTRCCGRPMLSNGLLEKARSNARFNVESVLPYVKNGVKLVGLEPSCILSFRDEYVEILDDFHDAKLVADNTLLIEEFVLFAKQQRKDKITFQPRRSKVLLHGHCHQKALVGIDQALEVLRMIPECDVMEIPSGCCGMAGAFGFEKEHYEISLKIGEQSLFPAIRLQQGDFEVVSEGISCRQQIQHGTGKRARHLVEVLAEAI